MLSSIVNYSRLKCHHQCHLTSFFTPNLLLIVLSFGSHMDSHLDSHLTWTRDFASSAP